MNIYDKFMAPLEKRILNDIRKEIIPKAVGDVLEIGVGTGVNFQFYNKNQITSFSVLDINISEIAKKRAPEDTSFIQSNSDVLKFDDNSFDTVVETLVLCSVDNESKMISEIKRVLKPDGLFIHIDHGLPRSDRLIGLFKFFAPLWHTMTRSCRIDKDQRAIILESGLEIIEDNRNKNGVIYWGIARKQSD